MKYKSHLLQASLEKTALSPGVFGHCLLRQPKATFPDSLVLMCPCDNKNISTFT